MKKLLLSATMATMVLSASARGYYDDGPGLFETIVSLVVLVISIIAIVKFFQIAKDIRAMREKIAPIQESEPLKLVHAAAELNRGQKSDAIRIAQNLMNINPSFSPEYRQAAKFIEEAENTEGKPGVVPFK